MAGFVRQLLLHPCQIGWIGEVGGDQLHFDAVRAGELLRQGFESIGAPRYQDKVVAPPCQSVCVAGANAGGCARDNGDFFEIGSRHDEPFWS